MPHTLYIFSGGMLLLNTIVEYMIPGLRTQVLQNGVGLGRIWVNTELRDCKVAY